MATAAPPLRRRKTIEEALAVSEEPEFRLKREVGALDVVVLGVGVIIGAGIFVLTGVAAATEAGPAIMLSFVLAAIVCAVAALCYTELAAMGPAAGSAYTFSYVTLGEFIAFIIGWDLVLEFTVGASAVSIGFAAYVNATLDQIFGFTLPTAITAPPSEGGVVNVFGILLVLTLVYVLVRGIRITAQVNTAITAATIAVLALVIAVGASEVDPANWSPFFPFGFTGVIGGAALVFFAFIVVAAGILLLRRTEPDRDRPFRTPLVPLVPIAAIILSFVLAATLDPLTWLRFLAWMALGLVVYYFYARKRSTVGLARDAARQPRGS